MPPRPIPGPGRPRTRARGRVPGGRLLPRTRPPGPAFCAFRTNGPGDATAPPSASVGRTLTVEGSAAAFCAFRTNARTGGGGAAACAPAGWPIMARRPGTAVRAIRTNRRGDAAALRFAPFGQNAGAGRRSGAFSAFRADAPGRGRRGASCARWADAGGGAPRPANSASSAGSRVCGLGPLPSAPLGVNARAARSVCRDQGRSGSACRSPGLFSYIRQRCIKHHGRAFRSVASLVLACRPSVDWCGCRQRAGKT